MQEESPLALESLERYLPESMEPQVISVRKHENIYLLSKNHLGYGSSNQAFCGASNQDTHHVGHTDFPTAVMKKIDPRRICEECRDHWTKNHG